MKVIMYSQQQRMCESTPTHAAARGRRVVQAVIALAFCVPLFLASCKKNEEAKLTQDTLVNNVLMRDGNDSLLELRIQEFYQQMKTLKADPNALSGSLSLDSTKLLVEATYNYYVARNSVENMQEVYFSIVVPTTNESLPLSNVSNAFWRIKDSLVNVFNSITYDQKHLASIEVQVSVTGTSATLNVKASIANGPEPTGSYITLLNRTKYLNTANDHVYAAERQSGISYSVNVPWYGTVDYGNGQSDISLSTEVLTSPVNTTVPSSKPLLRSLGIYNTYGPFFGQTSPLAINLQSVEVTYSANTSITAPTPYVNAYGYNASSDYYSTAIFFDCSCPGFALDDIHYTLKKWLTTPLMNSYISAIPSKLNAGLPTGKVAYDFNVTTNDCLCLPFTYSYMYNGRPYLSTSHHYLLTYGTPTRISNPLSVLGLSTL